MNILSNLTNLINHISKPVRLRENELYKLAGHIKACKIIDTKQNF